MSGTPPSMYEWPPRGSSYQGLPYFPTDTDRREPSPSPPLEEQVARAIQAANKAELALDQNELSEPQPETENPVPPEITHEVTVYDQEFNSSFPVDPALHFGDKLRMRHEDFLPPVRWQDPGSAPPAPQPIVFRHGARHGARDSVAPYPPARLPTSTVAPSWNLVSAWNNVPPGTYGPHPTVATLASAPVVTAWSATPVAAWSYAPARPAFAPAKLPTPAVQLPQTPVSGGDDDTRVHRCPVPGCSKYYTRKSSMRKHVRSTHPGHAHLVVTNYSSRAPRQT